MRFGTVIVVSIGILLITESATAFFFCFGVNRGHQPPPYYGYNPRIPAPPPMHFSPALKQPPALPWHPQPLSNPAPSIERVSAPPGPFRSSE